MISWALVVQRAGADPRLHTVDRRRVEDVIARVLRHSAVLDDLSVLAEPDHLEKVGARGIRPVWDLDQCAGTTRVRGLVVAHALVALVDAAADEVGVPRACVVRLPVTAASLAAARRRVTPEEVAV